MDTPEDPVPPRDPATQAEIDDPEFDGDADPAPLDGVEYLGPPEQFGNAAEAEVDDDAIAPDDELWGP